MKKAALILAAVAAFIALFGGESGLDRAAERLEEGIGQCEVAAFIFGAGGESFV